MNICVIGLGSMGKRRIRLLKRIQQVKNIYGIDLSDKRRNAASLEFEIDCYPSLENLIENHKINAAIISTPPLSHSKIISECLEKNLHVFTEINLVDDGYDRNIKLAKKKKKLLFLSSTFLYRKEIQEIKKMVGTCSANYIYHVGQYLPDWHPWESYKDFFVSDKRTNGCRELLAIELPWIIDIFGTIKEYSCFKRKTTNLAFDYDDTYTIIFRHINGSIGSVNIDVVSRVAKRNLCIYDQNHYIEWDGTPDSLKRFDLESRQMLDVATYTASEHNDMYSKNIIEDAYFDELKNFIHSITGQEIPRYSFAKDKELIRLINAIEEGTEK